MVSMVSIPIGSMYAIYTNIWGIWMVNVTIYIAYMDSMGFFLLVNTAAFNRNSFRQFFQLQVQRGHTLTAAAGKEAWSTGCL